MKSFLLAIALALLLPVFSYAQWFNPSLQYRVQEDNQRFFFQPSEFSTIKSGAFDDVMETFSNHQLTAINRNPANLKLIDSDGYVYMDIQTLPDEQKLDYYDYNCPYCYYPMTGIAWTSSYYNIYLPPQEVSRESQQPFLSAAFMLSPFENKAFTMGFTYQLISTSESYYDLQDYYVYPAGYLANEVGQDYQANNYFAPTSTMDKYAHFPALYLGYEWSDRLSTGIKVSYNGMRGNGSQISDEFAEYSFDIIAYPQSDNFSRNREMTYDHWDFAGGITLELNDRMDAGFSVGYLTGTFNQDGQNIYFTDYDVTDDSYYLYNSESQARSGFDRDGTTMYSTLEYDYKPSTGQQLRFTYRNVFSNQDLRYGMTNTIHSLNENEYTNSQDQVRYSETEGRTKHYAEGNGDRDSQQHRFGVSLDQRLTGSFNMQLGVQLGFLAIEENTNEDYLMDSSSDGYEQVDNEEPVPIYSGTSRLDDHLLKQNFDQFSLYIPLVFSKSFGSSFEVQAGGMFSHLNVISKYQSDIVTTYVTENLEDGELVEDTNTYTDFYTDRTEENQNRFNAFGGITYRPTGQVQLHLMTFSDRRDLSPVRSIDGFGFQFGMEVEF